MRDPNKSELRYGGAVIALGAPELLFREKAEMIVDGSVRYPSLLKIHFAGEEPWIFDRDFDRHEASVFLVEGFPYY